MAPANGSSATTTATTTKPISSTMDSASSTTTNPTTSTQRIHLPSSSIFSFKAPSLPTSSALTSSTASPLPTTSTLPTSMSTPSSPLKQRRVSLAFVDSSTSLTAPHRTGLAWSFRDDTRIESHVAETDYLVPEKRGKLRKIILGGLEDSTSDVVPGESGTMTAMLTAQPQIIQHPPISLLPEKKQRKKWSAEETQMLVEGCNRHGVGNWKAILSDPDLKFDNRSPVDLKDRFRTYFPDAYKQHYPNARTHLSSKIRSTLPDGTSLFEKTRSKKRRPFTKEEDEALRAGYEKHGTVWAAIVKDPIFQEQNRRSTDLRDRFRNAFPELYQAAGYKPRNSSRKRTLELANGVVVPPASSAGSSMTGGVPTATAAVTNAGSLGTVPTTLSMRHLMTGRAATDDQLSMSTTGPVRSRRRAHTTSQGLGVFRGGTKSVPQSNACSEDEGSSGGEEDDRDTTFKLPTHPASAFPSKSPSTATSRFPGGGHKRRQQSLPVLQHNFQQERQQSSAQTFQQQPLIPAPFSGEPTRTFSNMEGDEMELVTLDESDSLLFQDSLMMRTDDTDSSAPGVRSDWTPTVSSKDASISVSTAVQPTVASISGLDTPTHSTTPHTQHSQWPSASSAPAHTSTTPSPPFQRKRPRPRPVSVPSGGNSHINVNALLAINKTNGPDTSYTNSNATLNNTHATPASVSSAPSRARNSTDLGDVDLELNLGSPLLVSSSVPAAANTTIGVTSPAAANNTRNGNNNNIGKSPWATQDWLSPNPRLGLDAGPGANPVSGSSSSASGSFFDSGSAGVISNSANGASSGNGNGNGNSGGGGGGGSGYLSGYLSPVSSPFSMSNHSLSYGVMERYDLFPSSSQLMNDWDIDWMSEVGYGDSHSTFSDDSFPISSSASVSTGMGVPPAAIAGVFANGSAGLSMSGIGGSGMVGGAAMYGYGGGSGLGRGFTHHSNYAGDLIFSARTHQPAQQGFYGGSLSEGLGLSFPGQPSSTSTSAQQKHAHRQSTSAIPDSILGAANVNAEANVVGSSTSSVASSSSPDDEHDLQQQQTPQSVKSGGVRPLQLHLTPMLPGIDEIELTGISLADDEDDAMDVVDLPMEEGDNAGGLGLFLTSPGPGQAIVDGDVDLDVDTNVGIGEGVMEISDPAAQDTKRVATPNASALQWGGTIRLSRGSGAESGRRRSRDPVTSPMARTHPHSRSQSQQPQSHAHSAISPNDRFSLDDLVTFPPSSDSNINISPPTTPVTRPRGSTVVASQQHQNIYPNSSSSQHGRSISVPPSEARSAYPPSGTAGNVGSYAYPAQQHQQPQHPQQDSSYNSLLHNVASQNTVTPGELYDLPFLDLHYYGHCHTVNSVTPAVGGANGSTTGMGLLDHGFSAHSAGVLGSTFHQQHHHTNHPHHPHQPQHHQDSFQHDAHLASRQGQALDLAGTSFMNAPSTINGLKGIDGAASGGLLGGLNLHTLQLISPGAVPPTTARSKNGSSIMGGGSFHQHHQAQAHHRPQSVVCPQDLLLSNTTSSRSVGDRNKRKRASWDGGHQ